MCSKCCPTEEARAQNLVKKVERAKTAVVPANAVGDCADPQSSNYAPDQQGVKVRHEDSILAVEHPKSALYLHDQ